MMRSVTGVSSMQLKVLQVSIDQARGLVHAAHPRAVHAVHAIAQLVALGLYVWSRQPQILPDGSMEHNHNWYILFAGTHAAACGSVTAADTAAWQPTHGSQEHHRRTGGSIPDGRVATATVASSSETAGLH